MRPSRALPYQLHTSANVDLPNGQVRLTFSNTGTQGAVVHVYDEPKPVALPQALHRGARQDDFRRLGGGGR